MGRLHHPLESPAVVGGAVASLAWWPVRKSRVGFRPRALSLMMSLEGTMVLQPEL